jgi:hypothetical protein
MNQETERQEGINEDTRFPAEAYVDPNHAKAPQREPFLLQKFGTTICKEQCASLDFCSTFLCEQVAMAVDEGFDVCF